MKSDFYEYERSLLGQILSTPSVIEEHSISANIFEDRIIGRYARPSRARATRG